MYGGTCAFWCNYNKIIPASTPNKRRLGGAWDREAMGGHGRPREAMGGHRLVTWRLIRESLGRPWEAMGGHGRPWVR